MKPIGLEAEVDELKLKVVEAKKVGIANFKELDAYKLMLNTTTV